MPTTTGYPYGPGIPQTSSNEPGVVLWDSFTTDPLIIQHAITAVPNQYFLGESLLSAASSPNGLVMFNELSNLDLYIDLDANKQPGIIEPGDEFPAVGFTETALQVLETQMIGAYFNITDKQKRMDRRDIARNGITRLANTLRKIHNQRVITAFLGNATIVANCTNPPAALWTAVGAKPLSDVRAAAWDIDQGNDLAYQASWVLCHPDAAEVLFGTDQVQNFAPRENPALNPLFRKDLTGLAGLNWVLHRGMDRTKVIVGSGTDAGQLVTELGLFVDTIPEPTRKQTRIQAGRAELPVIDQPYAVRVIAPVLAAA